MTVFRAVITTAAMLPILAYSQTPPAKAAAQPKSGEAAHAKLPDADLEAAIRARFAKSKIATNNFEVQVRGGVATLTGRTNVLQHKGTATRLARTAGAKEVVNRIQVSQAAKDKAAANLAGPTPRAQVKKAP